MVSSAFHNGAGATVAHAEALTGTAMGKQLPSGGAIEAGVPQDHLVTGGRCRISGHKGDAATVHALADVVVGFTLQTDVQALNQ